MDPTKFIKDKRILLREICAVTQISMSTIAVALRNFSAASKKVKNALNTYAMIYDQQLTEKEMKIRYETILKLSEIIEKNSPRNFMRKIRKLEAEIENHDVDQQA